jgi:hypothetical protein
MHDPDLGSGEWTALRRTHATSRVDLDGFLALLWGLRSRFEALSADLTSLGALVDELRTARGTRSLHDGRPLPRSDGHPAQMSLPIHPAA